MKTNSPYNRRNPEDMNTGSSVYRSSAMATPKPSGISLMNIAKLFGVVFAGIGTAVVSTMLLGRTSLSNDAQDGILVAEGVVLGGVATAFGAEHLAIGLLVAPVAVAAVRWGTRMTLDAQMNAMAQRADALLGPQTTPQAATPAAAQANAAGMPYYALNAPAGYPVEQSAYLGYGVGVGAG